MDPMQIVAAVGLAMLLAAAVLHEITHRMVRSREPEELAIHRARLLLNPVNRSTPPEEAPHA